MEDLADSSEPQVLPNENKNQFNFPFVYSSLSGRKAI